MAASGCVATVQISRHSDRIRDGLASYCVNAVTPTSISSNHRKERTQPCQIPSRATGPNRRLWRSRKGGSSKIRCNRADTARSFPRAQHATASQSSRRQGARSRRYRHVRFVLIAYEPSHRSNSTRCARTQLMHRTKQKGYSITSLAVASNIGGTVRPSILAVSALMTSSNLSDCTTGRSAGLEPLRMRPT